MVAMDCGLLESRLDRLSASDRMGRGQRLESGGSGPTDRLSERTYGVRRLSVGSAFASFFGKIEEVAEMPNLY